MYCQSMYFCFLLLCFVLYEMVFGCDYVCVQYQTEYQYRKFPQSAQLVDVLRCSVTCDNAKDLYYVLYAFIDKVKNKQGGLVADILRIKNGFKKIPKWRESDEIENYNYVDIKLNILINSEDGNTALVGECQFLLKWLLKSKKTSHKLYGVKRRKEFVINVSNMMGDDCFYSKYKKKIHGMISNDNYDHLSQHLIWNENVLMSMISGIPLLSKILGSQSTRSRRNVSVLKLFLSCLAHYDNVCINDNSINFGRKYINYRNSSNTIFQYYFWGVDARKLKKDSNSYQVIELVMKSEYFEGITNDNIMYTLCMYDCYVYLSIIWKYHMKNLNGISKGINKKYSFGDTPLIKLLMSDHCNDDYLKLFLKFGKINKNTKIDMTAKHKEQSIYDICKQRGKQGEIWQNMLRQYAKETGQK